MSGLYAPLLVPTALFSLVGWAEEKSSLNNMLTGEPAGEAIREDGAIVALEPSRQGTDF